MTDSAAKPKLITELESIEQWRLEQAETYDKTLVDLAAEEQKLREQIAELQSALEANADKQAQTKGELATIPQEVVRRSHQALLDALEADRGLVEARAAALQEVRELAMLELQEKLEEPETAAAIEEYEKFREVEPVLGSLPPSYRQVVMDHHEALKTTLGPLFELAAGPNEPLDLERAEAVMVASVDIVDDKPAAFALFLPVDFQVYRGWADRAEDLAAQLAYRVVSGLSVALDKLGAPDAPVVYQDFEGCISIQVWLDDHDLDGDVAAVMGESIEAALAAATELEQARLGVGLAWVEPSVIGPEDDLSEEQPGEEPGEDADPLDDSPESAIDSLDDDKKFKPVQIVLRRGGSDQW
jgi:hypothetical protein